MRHSVTIARRRREFAGRPLLASDMMESMPPSPWLSARITIMAYLTVTTSMRVQTISESTP